MAGRKKPREPDYEEPEITPIFPEAPEVDWAKMERIVSGANVVDLSEDDSILRDEDMNDPELLAAYEELHREETAAAAAKAPPSQPRAPAPTPKPAPASAPKSAPAPRPPVASKDEDEFAALEQWGSDDAHMASTISEPFVSSRTVDAPAPSTVNLPAVAKQTSANPAEAAPSPSVFQVRTQGLMPDFIVPPPRAEAKPKAAPKAQPPLAVTPSEAVQALAADAVPDPRRAELEAARRAWGRAWNEAKARGDAPAVKQALLAIKKHDALLHATALPDVLPALPTAPPPTLAPQAAPAPAAAAPPVAAAAKPAPTPTPTPVRTPSTAARPTGHAAASPAARPKAAAKSTTVAAPAASSLTSAAMTASERDVVIPEKLELPKIGGTLLDQGPEGEKYRDIEAILRRQVEQMHSRALEAKASDDKVLAIQYYRLRRDLLLHYHHLAHLSSLRLPLPPIICLSRPLQREVLFRHIAEDELEISVLSASSLPLPPGFAYSSIDPYVFIQFPYPNESSPLKMQTPSAKGTTYPSWDRENTFTVRIERKRGGPFEKFIARRRVPIEVYQPRFLMRHVLLAKGELRLQRLGAEAEVIENVALQSLFGGNSKSAHGSVQIRLRLRTPLAGRQFTSVEELITFFAPVHANAHLLPPPATPTLYELMPQPLVAPTPAAPSIPAPVAASPAPVPAHASHVHSTPSVAPPAAAAVVIPPVPTSKPPPIPAAAESVASPSPAPPAIAPVLSTPPVVFPTTPVIPPSPAPIIVSPPAAAEPPAPQPVAKAAPAAVATLNSTLTTAAPPAQTAPLAASAKPKATPAPKPAAKKPAAAASAVLTVDDELDIEAWESVDNMVSNNVMEAEFAKVTKEVALLTSHKKEVPEELADRKTALEIKMKVLMLNVQTEKISLEDYMQQLRQMIEAERKFAAKCVAQKTPEYTEAAKRALVRAKLMETELTEQADEGEA